MLDSNLRAALAATDAELAAAVREATVDFATAIYGIVLRSGTGDAVTDVHEDLRALLTAPEEAPATPAAAPDPPLAPLSRPLVQLAAEPSPAPAAGLAGVVERVLEEQCRWLGAATPPDAPDALWEWLVLQCWRLPASERQDVLARATALVPDGGTPGPFGPSLLVPACPAFGHPGRGAGEQVSTALAPADPAVETLARTLDELLTVASSCADLRKAFRSDMADPMPGSPDGVAVYGRLVADLARTSTDPLKIALTLYEGIGSLFPWPLPAPDSLWSTRVREAARLVAELNHRTDLRLFILDANGQLPRQAPVRWMKIFSPREQPDGRVWQLRIGVQVRGQTEERGEALLLAAQTSG